MITGKILKLELKKVRYIRSLSFVQGTTVNFLRTSFLFLLYYLVFKDVITPGKLLTLTFFSFFIFGPLQELGNVIAVYREAQASLQTLKDIKNPPMEMNVRAQTAIIGNNQLIQSNNNTEVDKVLQSTI